MFREEPFCWGTACGVLGQAKQGRFEEAERERERLKEGWPLCWSGGAHEGWIAWARVLVMKAKERSWPQNPWGILNQLGSCEVNMVLLLVSRSASSHMSITCRSNKM